MLQNMSKWLIVHSLWFLVLLVTPVSAHSEIYTVIMQEDGFEPAEITVDENSTILFINKDKVDRWPASNIHPTHGIYPQFDPQKSVTPGSSWVFKPKKVGTWKYHDHLNPHQRGVITVNKETTPSTSENIEDKTQDENILSKIKNYITSFFKKFMSTFKKLNINKTISSEDFKKLADDEQIKGLENIFESKGAQYTWVFFKTTFKGEAGSSGNIHDLAHYLGSLMYENGGFEAISFCTTEYAFGCYHGFLDKAFEKGLDELAVAELACSRLGPINSGPVASCIHGIGHGIASFYNTSDIKGSLASCNRLQTGSNYCHDGVFMEFARGASNDFYPESDRLSPCSILKEEFGDKYSFACGRNQPEVLMQRFNYTFEAVVDLCLVSEDPEFKTACFDTLGFKLASTTNSADGIIAGCAKISDAELNSRCVQSAAGELIFQEVPGWQQKAPTVCNSLQMPYYTSCHQHLQRLISDYKRI